MISPLIWLKALPYAWLMAIVSPFILVRLIRTFCAPGPISQMIYEQIIEIFCSNFQCEHSIRSQFCTCHDSWAAVVCAKMWPDVIHQFKKSQNAPDPYPTMLHSEQKCAHFSSEWSIVGYDTGAFLDLWIRSIRAISNFKIWMKSL